MTVTLGGVALVGQITLERDGTKFGVAQQTQAYSEWVESGRDPRAFPGDRHEHVEHQLRLVVKDGTVPLPTVIENIERAARAGATLTVQYDATTRWTRVVDADFSQTVVAFSHAIIDVGLRCIPYWHAAERSYTPNPIGYASCVFDQVPLVGGSVPALTRTGVTTNAASTGVMAGIRPDKPDGYVPIQDYQGAALANALSGEAATVSLTSTTHFSIGTPTKYLPDVHGPAVVPVARVQQATADTVWRAQSQVQGSNHPDIGVFDGYRTRQGSTTGSLQHLALGTIPIPAAAIPDTSSGATGEFGAEGVRLSQTNVTNFYRIDPEVSSHLYATAFTPTASFRFTKAEIWGAVEDWTATCTLEGFLHETYVDGSGNTCVGAMVDSGTASISGNTTGAYFTIEGWQNPVLAKGKQYAMLISWLPSANCQWDLGRYTTAGTMQIGAATGRTPGSLMTLTSQPKMSIYGSLPLDAEVSVQIRVYRTAGTTYSVYLDTLALVPVAWGAAYVNRSATANGGALLDFLSHKRSEWDVYRFVNDGVNPYGVGHSALAMTALYGPPPLLHPGNNAVVVAAFTNTTATPNVYLVLRWVERYLNPWGDE